MARLRAMSPATEAKASPNRAFESYGIDAKPSDLPLARMKSG